MDRIGVLTFRAPAREAEYLEDTSLRRLVLEYYDRENIAIQRYVVFLGISRDTAQEIAQESFLKLHQHLLRDGDRTNLRAWLYRVAHNLARNIQTTSHAGRTVTLPEATELGKLQTGGAPVEQALLDEERIRQLRQAMEHLTPAQKEALMLRTQGLKYREIAEILNLSVSTVGEDIQRGLERLKELL